MDNIENIEKISILPSVFFITSFLIYLASMGLLMFYILNKFL